MNTAILVYLIIGCMFGSFLLWTTTDKDYDQFVRDFFEQEPPSLKEKLTMALSSVILWPLHLYWIVKR
jgi:hypothetical protein